MIIFSVTNCHYLFHRLLISLLATLIIPEMINGKQQINPNPTFPFCFYGSENKVEGQEPSYLKAYQESYCNAFQTTFNEHGLCYTINNSEQGFDEILEKG